MPNNDLRNYLAKKFETQVSEYGDRLRTTAESVRGIAGQLRDDPNTVLAAGLVRRGADAIDRIGIYVQVTPLERMAADAERLGRKQPWLLATAGVAAGLFASRLLKATAARRGATDGDLS
jgi:hypothetical protein